jgi:hypothetical protein
MKDETFDTWNKINKLDLNNVTIYNRIENLEKDFNKIDNKLYSSENNTEDHERRILHIEAILNSNIPSFQKEKRKNLPR